MAGVLAAARTEAGKQRHGEEHTRTLRLTSDWPQAHTGEARAVRQKGENIMRGKQKE